MVQKYMVKDRIILYLYYLFVLYLYDIISLTDVNPSSELFFLLTENIAAYYIHLVFLILLT